MFEYFDLISSMFCTLLHLLRACVYSVLNVKCSSIELSVIKALLIDLSRSASSFQFQF